MLDLVRNPEDRFSQDAVDNNMVFQKKEHNNSLVSITHTSFVYCREFAPGTVSLTGDWVPDDDIKQTSYYNHTQVTKRTNTVAGPSYPVSDQAAQRLRWAQKPYCQLCHPNYIIVHLSPGI